MNTAMLTPPVAPSDDTKQGVSSLPPNKSPFRRRIVPYLYLSPTLILMIVLMAVPVIMVIWYSTMDNVITEQNPEFVGLDNYGKVLSNSEFWDAMKHTILFAGASVIAHIILGLAFGLLLNSEILSNVTKAVFRLILVLPWLFTVAIVAVLWRMLLNPNGVINHTLEALGFTDGRTEWLSNPSTALWSIILINIWSGYPFYMISILAGLQGISADLYEAARVDGASAIQRFIHVTIPQLKPLLISLALLDFIWTTQNFALIWMTTGGGPMNVTDVLATFTYKLAFGKYQFSMASTSAVIILLFSLILAVFYSRAQKSRG